MGASVILKTPVNTRTGYGNDGHGLATGFVDNGWDVHLAPTSVHVPIPMTVAQLLTKEPAPPYDMLLNHIDPGQVGISDGDRKVSPLAVAWTMWEWNRYNPKGHTRLAKELKAFDVLACYDPTTVEALTPIADKAKVKVVQAQGGYEPKDWPYLANRDWSGTYRYCMVGQLGVRKNPFAAVEAFALLKERHGEAFDAELHLKTNMSNFFHPAMLDAYPWLKIHVAVWSHGQMVNFYGNMHTLLAPSHGEGKNMPCLEAQSTGIPTIATGWGGHTVWQDPSYSLSIDYTLEEFEQQGQWAVPSVEHLADLMWAVYNKRDAAQDMGRVASRVIPAQFSWEAVVQRLLQRLRDDAGVTI